MNVLSIVIIIFIILETANITILYFSPGSKIGNGIGVFAAYEKSKADPEIHALITYLINWVAGTKLIFIGLLLVIVVVGDETTQLFAVIALIPAILSFYWRLFPAIRKMDRAGLIKPRGYSRILGLMIGCFIGVFVIALAVYLLPEFLP